MNKRCKDVVLFLIAGLSSLSPAFGFAEGLCERSGEILNNEAQLVADISEALAREDKQVALAYLASYELNENDIEQTRRRALQLAFRDLVRLAIKSIVSEERLKQVFSVVQQKIYQKSRLFIRSFQTLPSERCEKQYRVPVKVVLNLDDLRKALLRHQILEVAYTGKEIRLVNVTNAKDYEWIKAALEKNIRNLKRVVEKYQKQREVTFWVETSSSLDEMMTRLDPLVMGGKGAPRFTLEKGQKGGLVIALLP